jgi:hypothetical protein
MSDDQVIILEAPENRAHYISHGTNEECFLNKYMASERFSSLIKSQKIINQPGSFNELLKLIECDVGILHTYLFYSYLEALIAVYRTPFDLVYNNGEFGLFDGLETLRQWLIIYAPRKTYLTYELRAHNKNYFFCNRKDAVNLVELLKEEEREGEPLRFKIEKIEIKWCEEINEFEVIENA